MPVNMDVTLDVLLEGKESRHIINNIYIYIYISTNISYLILFLIMLISYLLVVIYICTPQ